MLSVITRRSLSLAVTLHTGRYRSSQVLNRHRFGTLPAYNCVLMRSQIRSARLELSQTADDSILAYRTVGVGALIAGGSIHTFINIMVCSLTETTSRTVASFYV